MSDSRPAKFGRKPRRHAAATSALTAGLLVVIFSLSVVFSSDLRDLGRSLLGDDDNKASVDSAGLTETMLPSTEPEYTGVYVEADVGFPETFNPLLAESASEKTVAALLYRELLTTDERGDPAPDLATDWSVSADGLIHTIQLDPTARWHDGEPVSATDVLFTIGLARDAGFPGDTDLSQFWRAITVQRTGEYTVEFALLEPYAGFPTFLRIPVLPKHHLGDALPEDLGEIGHDGDVIGSGPFVLREVDQPNAELLFTAAEDSENAGFDEVVFRYYDSRDDAVRAFQDGDADGVSYLPLNILQDGEMLPDGAQIRAHELAGYSALYFNFRHPFFRDVSTRRAVEYAIDREMLVETVLGGHATPGSSPIPEMLPAHAPGEHREYDPVRAAAMLDDEGWKLEDDQDIRQRGGEFFHVPLIVNSEDPQRVAAAEILRTQLLEIGISVEVQALPEFEVEQALSSRQFAAAMFGWHTENGNLDFFQMWHSSQIEDGANFTGFADPEADDLLLLARRSASLEERDEHYVGFQSVFAEKVPAVVLFYPRYHYAVSERVQGAAPKPLVNPADRVRQFPQWYEGET